MKNYWGEESEEVPITISEAEKKVDHSAYIETVQNRIYFYSEIRRTEVLQLNKNLRTLSDDMVLNAKRENRETGKIYLHINSYGGIIFHGLAVMDSVLNCEVPVITVIDGCCASAATFISVVGRERWIHSHAYMLIHQLSSIFWGKYREFEDEKVNLDRLMDVIERIYLQYTKIPKKQIREILDHDLWFSAETCLEYGLVDKIIEAKK